MAKLDKQQELFLEGLTCYDNFFSEKTMNYFKSLVMLEVSILKKELSDSQLEMLMTKRLFEDIVRYNLLAHIKNIYRAKAKELGLQDKFYLIENPSNDNRNIFIDEMDLYMINPEYNPDEYKLGNFSLLKYSRRMDNPYPQKLEVTLFDFIDNIDIKSAKNVQFQLEMQKIFAQEFETKMNLEDYDMEMPDLNNVKLKSLTKVYSPLNLSITKIVSNQK